MSSKCHAIRYLILSSNCGHCPNITNDTLATCPGIFEDGQTCKFAVQTIVCDDYVGLKSEEVVVKLRGKNNNYYYHKVL